MAPISKPIQTIPSEHQGAGRQGSNGADCGVAKKTTSDVSSTITVHLWKIYHIQSQRIAVHLAGRALEALRLLRIKGARGIQKGCA